MNYHETDPEFMERLEYFAYDEVVNEPGCGKLLWGLLHEQRELITFCFLAAQGGCEPQLIAHAKGNINLGNDKDFLMRVVSQCLPYIGYPRSLNVAACINKAAE